MLPKLAPETDVGRAATTAYAGRAGKPVAEYVKQLDTQITPEIAGAAIVELVETDPAGVAPTEYSPTAAGPDRQARTGPGEGPATVPSRPGPRSSRPAGSARSQPAETALAKDHQ